MPSRSSHRARAHARVSIASTHLDGVELDAGLHNVDGGEGAVSDGAADTAGGGALEVVHEVVLGGAGGGHDGGVVGLHGWTIQVGNSSKKLVAISIGEVEVEKRMDEENVAAAVGPVLLHIVPDCRKCMLEARPFSGRGKFRCVSRAHKNWRVDSKKRRRLIFGVGCTLASFGFFAICTSRDDGNGPINTGHYRPTQYNRTYTVLDDHLGVHFGISLQ